MSRKQVTIIAILAIFIVAEIIIGFLINAGDDKNIDTQGETSTSTVKDVNKVTEFEELPEFTKQVSNDIVETQADEVIDVVTDPEKNESLGGYTVTASRDGFSPNVLTVTAGNIVRLTLKAVDEKYDLSIPAMSVYLVAPEGEENQTSFRVPQAGTFRFECQSFCPSSGQIFGKFTVKPR